MVRLSCFLVASFFASQLAVAFLSVDIESRSCDCPSTVPIGHYLSFTGAAQSKSENEHSDQTVSVGKIAGAPEKKPFRADYYGDPLPPYALKRYGTVRLKHADKVLDLAFSPNGKMLASCGADRLVILWDAMDGKEIRKLSGHKHVVQTLAFFPDGDVLASGDQVGEIIYWEVATGKILHRMHPHKLTFPHRTAIWKLTVSCNGFLASAGNGLMLWNKKGQQVAVLSESKELDTYGVVFSHDGQTLIAGEAARGHGNSAISVWDVPKRKRLKQQSTGDDHTPFYLALSPDGKVLAAGSSSALSMWDVKEMKQVHEWSGSGGVRTPIVFTDAGRQLTAGFNDGTLTTWSVATKKVVKTYPKRLGGLACLAQSPDRTLIAIGDGVTAIHLWEFGTLQERPASKGPTLAAVFPKNGLYMHERDGKCHFCDFATDKELYKWDRSLDQMEHLWGLTTDGQNVIAISWQYTGDFLAKYKLQFLDLKTGKKVRDYLVPEKQEMPPAKILICPDDKYLFAWWYASVSVYDLKTAERVHQRPGQFRTVALSPDGKYLALTTKAKLELVRVGTWKTHYSAAGKNLDHFAFSPDNKWLAATDGARIRAWDLSTGKELEGNIKNPGPPITAVVPGIDSDGTFLRFSPSGNFLAASPFEDDPSPLLIDLLSDKVIRKFTLPERPKQKGVSTFASPAGWFDRMEFSPDGRTLFSWSTDNHVHVWEVSTGKERLRLEGHQGMVRSLKVLPDQQTLLSFGDESTALLWDLSGWRTEPDQFPKHLPMETLFPLWQDLKGTDAKRAYRAIWQMAAAGKDTVTFLKGHLQPANKTFATLVEQDLADLDSDKDVTRQKAVNSLAKLGKRVEPAIAKALANNPSLRQRPLLINLRNSLVGLPFDAESLQQIRAVEVLEHIGDAGATNLLKQLSSGGVETWVSSAARSASQRLKLDGK
jgi:WD40 repeat protein